MDSNLLLIERVLDFIEDTSNDDEAVELVEVLYEALSLLASDNSQLEIEISMLNRRISNLENKILELEGVHLPS